MNGNLLALGTIGALALGAAVRRKEQAGSRSTPPSLPPITPTLPLYHGTKHDFTVFALKHPERMDEGWLGYGVYLTNDPGLAESYAMRKKGPAEPRVMEVRAQLQNPYIATAQDKNTISRKGAAESARATESLKRLGHDGVLLRLENGSIEVVVFDPARVHHLQTQIVRPIRHKKHVRLSPDDPVPTQIIPAGTRLYHGTASPIRFEKDGPSVFTAPFWVSRDPRPARRIAMDDVEEAGLPARVFHLRTTRPIGPLAILKTHQDVADLVADAWGKPRSSITPGTIGTYKLAKILADTGKRGWIVPGNYSASGSIFSYGGEALCRPPRLTCDDICLCLFEDVASLELLEVESIPVAQVQARWSHLR